MSGYQNDFENNCLLVVITNGVTRLVQDLRNLNKNTIIPSELHRRRNLMVHKTNTLIDGPNDAVHSPNDIYLALENHHQPYKKDRI